MYTKKQRVFAMLIFVLFVIAALFSLLFINKEVHHNCTGEECTICACLQQAEQTLKNLGTGISGVTAAVFFQVTVIFVVAWFCVFTPCVSLISEKVRLDN